MGPTPALPNCAAAVDLTRVNRRVLEALVKAGALDGLARQPRHADGGTGRGRAGRRAGHPRQRGRPGRPVRWRRRAIEVQPAGAARMAGRVRLAGEREVLGRFLSGHPIESFEKELQRLVSARLGDLAAEPPPTSGDAPRWNGGRADRCGGGLSTSCASAMAAAASCWTTAAGAWR